MRFTTAFPDSAHARVLDALLDEPRQEVTVSDLARASQVSRPTVYKIIDHYLDLGLLAPSRRVGNSQLYRLTPRHAGLAELSEDARAGSVGLRRPTLSRTGAGQSHGGT